MVHDREGTEMCPVYMGPRFRPFCVYCWKKLNNMLLCIKIMLICAVLTWKL